MLLKMLLQMEQCASGQNTNTFGKVIYRLLKKRILGGFRRFWFLSGYNCYYCTVI